MAASPLRLDQVDQARMLAAKPKRCCRNNRQMTYDSELTSWSNAYSNGVDTKWPRAIPCISSSPWTICGAMEYEQPSAKTMSRCKSPSAKEFFLKPHPNAPPSGGHIPSTHHPQPHWNSICCSRVNNRASWKRCRPRPIPLMLVCWLGAKTNLGYAEGHLIWPQHGRKLSCATTAGMCGLRSQ